MSKKKLIIGIFVLFSLSLGALLMQGKTSSPARTIAVYHSKTCSCCLKWIEHLKVSGFEVEAHAVDDMTAVKVERGVSGDLASCHTAVIDGYVIEGHVPVSAVEKLLKEKPDVRGLAVPGMPMGSPGMEGSYNDKYDVVSFKEGERKVFMTFTGKHAH